MRIRYILPAALMLAALATAQAGEKFPNKDTAKDRRDYTWGTQKSNTDSTTEFGTDPETGDSQIRLDTGPKKKPVDWYDKIIITVNPDTKWPENGTESSTTKTYNNATDTETTTTTTKEW